MCTSLYVHAMYMCALIPSIPVTCLLSGLMHHLYSLCHCLHPYIEYKIHCPWHWCTCKLSHIERPTYKCCYLHSWSVYRWIQYHAKLTFNKSKLTKQCNKTVKLPWTPWIDVAYNSPVCHSTLDIVSLF